MNLYWHLVLYNCFVGFEVALCHGCCCGELQKLIWVLPSAHGALDLWPAVMIKTNGLDWVHHQGHNKNKQTEHNNRDTWKRSWTFLFETCRQSRTAISKALYMDWCSPKCDQEPMKQHFRFLCSTEGRNDLERPWHGSGIGHGAATSILPLKGVEWTGENWGLDLSHQVGAVPLPGYFTGAGTWVGRCVLGEAGEADFLLTWEVDEGKGREKVDLLDIKVKSTSEDLVVIQ